MQILKTSLIYSITYFSKKVTFSRGHLLKVGVRDFCELHGKTTLLLGSTRALQVKILYKRDC